MKRILIPLCILLWVFQETSAAFPPMIITGCVKEHKLKGLELALFYGTEMAVASEPVKCYLTCLFTSMGIIDKGEINPAIIDMTQSSTNPQAVFISEMFKACKDVKSEVVCEHGFLLMKCLAEYGKDTMLHTQPNTEL